MVWGKREGERVRGGREEEGRERERERGGREEEGRERERERERGGRSTE